MITWFYSLTSLVSKSQAIQQSVVMAVGNGIMSALMAVATIIAARILGPEQFGVFSVLIAVMFLAAKATDGGIHQLIPRLFNKWNDNSNLQAAFMHWFFTWKVRLSILFLVISGLLVPLIQVAIGISDPMLVWFALIGALLLGWYEFIHLALAAKHKFFEVSILSIVQALVKFVGFGAITMYVIWAGIRHDLPDYILHIFVLIYCIAPVVAFGWAKILQAWKNPSYLANQAIKDTKNTEQVQNIQKTLSTAVRRFLPHAFIGTTSMVLIQNIDILLVNNQLNAFETGIYSGALRVALAISLFTFAISSVLNNRITRYNTAADIRAYLQKAFFVVFAAMLGFILFIPFARLTLVLTIGPEYVAGLIPFIILIGNAFLGLALVPFTSFFFRLDVPWANSVGGLLQIVPLIAINMLFLSDHGLEVAAVSRVISTTLFALLVAWLVWRSWKKEFSDAL